MRSSKKLAAVFGAAFLTLAGLAGCSGSGDDSASEGTQENAEVEGIGEKIAEGEVGGCPVILWEDGTLEFTCNEIVGPDDNYIRWTGDFEDTDLFEQVKRVKSGTIKASGSLWDLFIDARNLSDISDLEKWDVSNVTDMTGILCYTDITSIDALANWDTSNVMHMGGAFHGTSITSVDALANWDTSNVIDMSSMFTDVPLTDIDALANWDTSNVVDMSLMFQGTNISSVDALANWDTSNVVDMSWMFHGTNISSVDALANWDTSNVTNMWCMFFETNVTRVADLPNWDLSNLEHFPTDIF